jgi:hypothetical protein
MGTNLHDVYEAIFEAEPDVVEDDEELFADREQDRIGLHSWASREPDRNSTHTAPPEVRIPESPARVGRHTSSIPRSYQGQPSSSPRNRKLSLRPSLAEPLRGAVAEARTPLSRLFGARWPDADKGQSPVDAQKLDKVEEGVRRVQELLEDVRELPAARLNEEMRELQERQARIEGLLLMLTRGMRNQAGSLSGAAPSRYDTI